MILLFLSETAYLLSMGTAISSLPDIPENIFINPAGIGGKGITITYYNPFGVPEYYSGEVNIQTSIKTFPIGMGIRIENVNRDYTEANVLLGSKFRFIGFSVGFQYKKSPFSTRIQPIYKYGLQIKISHISLGYSPERKGIGFLFDWGKISIETDDFHQLYTGVEYSVNKDISGMMGWNEGKPSFGIALSTKWYSVLIGFTFNADLGTTNIYSIRWKI